jgi:hypothetical protein
MLFTALHKHLGHAPGPITDELLDAAVAAQLEETDDLDWKSKLPPAKGLAGTDFPKDVAAMANSGGGTIVYGVKADGKAAAERCDVGDFDESYESALRFAAVSAISPPVLGVGVRAVGPPGNRAVIVVVPPSSDGPHLIYRGEQFGAPVRIGAYTDWMKERQIEAMYRARFDARRYDSEALDQLYAEARRGHDTYTRAWLFAVARPLLPVVDGTRLERDEAVRLFSLAADRTLRYSTREGVHPFDGLNFHNPARGLRRWTATPSNIQDDSWWGSAVTLHQDGAASVAAAVGGRPRRGDGPPSGAYIESSGIESAVCDLMALVRVISEERGAQEFEVRVGIESAMSDPIVIGTVDRHGWPYDHGSTPLSEYTPVTATVRTNVSERDFLEQLHSVVLDCINQGGIINLRVLRPLPSED